MRKARERSRGYADHFGSGFGKTAVELQVAMLLRGFMVHHRMACHGCLQANRPNEVPDVLLHGQRGGTWGIEVTEIVEPDAVARARYIEKGNTDQEPLYGYWDPCRLANKLRARIHSKDPKLAASAAKHTQTVSRSPH